MFTFFKNALYGLIIGVANIIPGVSGGTMAVVLNIYDRLIDAVGTLRKHFKKNLLFLIPIAAGAGIGILLFSTLIKYLLAYYPMPTNFFFLGLVAGSFPMIFRRATSHGFKPTYLIPAVAAFAALVVITFAPSGGQGAVMTQLTPLSAIWLAVCGAVASACMILPGVSGSMVMMILGVYTTILTAISDFNIPLLIPVALGILLGLFGGAKLIAACMDRFFSATYFAIIGLIAGSIVPVLRNAGFSFGLQGLFSLCAFAAGIACTILMSRLQKSLEQKG